MNFARSQSFPHVTNIKSDPGREISATIKDATFGSEWGSLLEYVGLPGTFPSIGSTCRGEESGGRSWGEDLRLTNLLNLRNLCNPDSLPVYPSDRFQQQTHTHNGWIFNKHLIYTSDIWIRAPRLLQPAGAEMASGRLIETVFVPKDATWDWKNLILNSLWVTYSFQGNHSIISYWSSYLISHMTGGYFNSAFSAF